MPRASIRFIVQEVPNAFRGRRNLRAWLSAVARHHRVSIGELSFVLMSDRALLAYNRKYLSHDYFTDVITFDDRNGGEINGDILLSYDRIKDNARAEGVSLQDELHRVMLHGLLHLLGHRDKTKDERRTMRRAEDRFLKRLK